MRCLKCGSDNPGQMKFCVECGAALNLRCVKRAFENPPQAKFCGSCGANLEESRSISSKSRSAVRTGCRSGCSI